ncbi:MAG: trimeric intracellular cation channel family protein [Erysipelotrichaceae bacterium]|nr:trimeric intracellular cation channel family protein [Erysipelotrichaceae bacterium]
MFVIEIIGVISFAVSGSIVAMKRECDLFGVIVLGVATATGGGIIRDMLLGIHPPIFFQKPIYAAIAAFSSVLAFLVVYFNHGTFTKHKKQIEYLDLISDSLGLGIFVVVGINTTISQGSQSLFLIQFIGIMTGVGGGILRDMMAVQIPMVLRKRIYAVAALLGGLVYYYSLAVLPPSLATVVSIGFTVTIRALAAHYKWNLPKVSLKG